MLKRFAAAFALTASTALLPLPAAAQEAPQPGAARATTDIVLTTELGPIVIALETEAAPLSAANFLRYVDEKRLDGTVFYRAMRLDWDEQPAGLIQGGTQFDPARILPPVAHEPTTQTGLSHTVGAVSLARNEPGTATADFSIMVSDQTGLDANPKSEDPTFKDGYAVFGYVTDGMTVVRAIFDAPTDPDKGEGWMKGQMIAQPVKILTARRLAAP